MKNKGYLLVKEYEGIARISGFSKKKPAEGDYIAGKLSYSYDDKHMIKNPFDRYYVEQKLAFEMEKKLRESNKAYLVVKIYRGKYIIESIEI